MIRVEVTRARGSVPREKGAMMHVTNDGIQGTIGGGQLEYMAIDRARQMLARGETAATMDVPLGPEIGQCCGGRVELTLTHVEHLPAAAELPQVLIFGAGHVGRALARALALLPVRPIVIDQRPAELALASGETRLTPLPEAEIRKAPYGSSYVILTHDHALDFLLAAEALRRLDAPYIGMIGSNTKLVQFRRHARAQGLDTERLTCPIGAGWSQDKRPEIIAAFTAAELIGRLTQTASKVKRQSCDN
ncbi:MULTISPECIES: xanthine dehydrogenase accessory protein XdhC [unclassified Paracoccus (in: a-proteobacteria)]|uniref:xanthine dehydrogenase accessory protein XdhC n=1 Tax=unclassified Paracoccus (in: a-proteobacteria) TaxID=2688777 RepID=UPI0012B34CCC|nr:MULTISPECIES: xanthine dehydrogenase accessory protein XdhC [unclassified Paracoccus (in: a-proteobacteria)]UXU76413.1 xanthine dehydrogenase accessory protein XdhC [Paracoccus sp. SMMA_5]UXU82249.1 xanthine dehydrogenase accessory protein XdhC [Paracoccus sp. SMMA_5_TC]